MRQADVRRLIAISSIGIYQASVPAVLKPYRDLADAIEASDLDYTILRPDWFTHDNSIDYHITHKGEAEIAGAVSRRSIANHISNILFDPASYRQNVGISRPV